MLCIPIVDEQLPCAVCGKIICNNEYNIQCNIDKSCVSLCYLNFKFQGTPVQDMDVYDRLLRLFVPSHDVILSFTHSQPEFSFHVPSHSNRVTTRQILNITNQSTQKLSSQPKHLSINPGGNFFVRLETDMLQAFLDFKFKNKTTESTSKTGKDYVGATRTSNTCFKSYICELPVWAQI